MAYVVRRVWEVKPREARRAASLLAELGRRYEAAGKRSPSTVYFNGGTLPGDKDRVYMQWTEESIQSPYRADAGSADTGTLGEQLREVTLGSWIEFFELLTPDKALPVEA